MRPDADHAGIGIGQRETVAERRDGDWNEQSQRVENAHAEQNQRQDHTQHRDAASDRDHAVDADALRKTARTEISEHVAEWDDAEIETVLRRRQTEHLGRHIGPAAEEGEEHARGEGRHRGVAPEAARPEQFRIGADLRQHAAGAGMVGLAKVEKQHREGKEAEEHGQHEGRLPAEMLVEKAANQRSEHRRQRHAHRHVADLARGLVGGHHVAHDRAGEHHAGCRECLQHAAQKQNLDGWCEDRRQRAENEDREAGQHHRPPPEPVGCRPDAKLQHRGRRQVERHHELHNAVVGVEMARDRWKRRQEDVHRQRTGGRRCDQA